MSGRAFKLISRKKFLQLSTKAVLWLAGGLGLAGLIRYFSYTPVSGSQLTFDLGPREDFPSSGRMLRVDIPAVIYRRGSDYQAFSLVCTHLGCVLEESPTGYTCPCHGSQFSLNGRVESGPAVKDLAALKIELTEEGDLLLHKEDPGP